MHRFILLLLLIIPAGASANRGFVFTGANAVTAMDLLDLFGAEAIEAGAQNGVFYDVKEILCEVDSRMGGERKPTCMIRFSHSDGSTSQLRPRDPRYSRAMIDLAKEARLNMGEDEQRAGAKLMHIKDMRCQRAGRRAECRGRDVL